MQLYQALDWLSADIDSNLATTSTWLDLQAQLQCLGAKPEPHERFLHMPEDKALSATLTQLGLQHKLSVTVGTYAVNAVLRPPTSMATPILILVEDPDCFTNQPTRYHAWTQPFVYFLHNKLSSVHNTALCKLFHVQMHDCKQVLITNCIEHLQMQSAQDCLWAPKPYDMCPSCYFSLILLLFDTMLCMLGSLRGRALFRQRLLSMKVP